MAALVLNSPLLSLEGRLLCQASSVLRLSNLLAALCPILNWLPFLYFSPFAARPIPGVTRFADWPNRLKDSLDRAEDN
jgi:hypothetical protein